MKKVLITLSVIAVLFAILFWILVPWFFDYYTDGFSIHQSSRSAEIREILWEIPKALNGKVNSEPEAYEPTLSRDGLTMIFTLGKALHNADLFVTRWSGEAWEDPKSLESINTEYDELGPELSQDGRYLYFYSNRPGGVGGFDIWMSRWDGKAWSPPENPGESINSEFNEYGPGLTPEGDVVYFSSNRLRREMTEEERQAWQATLREDFLLNDYDIFSARADVATHQESGEYLPPMPGFSEAKRLDFLNTPYHEGQVAVTPRGDFLYFSSNREGGLGGFDLYRCRIFRGELLEPENMGLPVNSGFNEMDPSMILEGHGLVFSSNRALAEGKRPYRLYRSVSREVIVRKDLSGLSALLKWLDSFKWWLLLLLLMLLALLYLLRYLLGQRFRMSSSLLHRCLLASILLHILLALLTSTWIVTAGLYELKGDPSGELTLNLDALAEDRLGLEIREQLTDLEAASDEEMPIDPADTLAMEDPYEPLTPQEREFEPLTEDRQFSPEPPPSLPVAREARELDELAFEAALEPMPLRDFDRSLEEPERKASTQDAAFDELEDRNLAEQRIDETAPSSREATLPAPPLQDRSVSNNEPLIFKAASFDTPSAKKETLPSLDQPTIEKTREEIEPEDIAMEATRPRQREESPEVVISNPKAVTRMEGEEISEEPADIPESDILTRWQGNPQEFSESAVAEAKANPLPRAAEDLPRPSNMPESHGGEPTISHDIRMETPEAGALPRHEDQELREVRDSGAASKVELALAVPKAELDVSSPVTNVPSDSLPRSSPLKNLDVDVRSIVQREELLDPASHTQRPIAKTQTTIDQPKMEMPQEKAAVARKELSAINLVEKASKKELNPASHRTELLARPPVDLPEVARTFNEPAVAHLSRHTLPETTPRLEPVETAKVPPPLRRQEPPAVKSLETLARKQKPQSKSSSAKQLLPLEDADKGRPLPLAFPQDSPPLEMAFKPDEKEEKSVVAALELPPREESALEREITQYEHDEPRTYHGLEMKARKVVFCLDVSSSMEWNNRIGEAREELLRLLDTLDESIEFNIVSFSGRVRIWNRSGVQVGTPENIESAKRFVRRARIASDGTNTVSALTMALSDEDVECIYFLSDGHPTVGYTTDNDEILDAVRKQKGDRDVVIHTIAYIKGLPPPQWRREVPPKRVLIDLMQRLAEQNNGNYVVFD